MTRHSQPLNTGTITVTAVQYFTITAAAAVLLEIRRAIITSNFPLPGFFYQIDFWGSFSFFNSTCGRRGEGTY
jgi:hypothetical protein